MNKQKFDSAILTESDGTLVVVVPSRSYFPNTEIKLRDVTLIFFDNGILHVSGKKVTHGHVYGRVFVKNLEDKNVEPSGYAYASLKDKRKKSPKLPYVESFYVKPGEFKQYVTTTSRWRVIGEINLEGEA